MASFFEFLMMVCFGVSWPFSVGYICGMIGKFISGNVNYVLIMYVINTLLVTADILLYFRNTKLDRLAEPSETVG